MKKIYFILLLALSQIRFAQADEGMWLPILLEKLNEPEMQDLGFKLTAADIYSINQSCLKDAVFQFGGGCTAELISSEGLLLTNHHCGYRSIQNHSTLEHDYLKNGFWAMTRNEELPNPGLTATRLIRMEDVTAQVLKGVREDMTESQRQRLIASNIDALKKEATSGTSFQAVIKPFYYGNEYYMFINEVFTDIRLVGAPPSSIGKFGGDTDNWMWPRHTGDFSLFRIYVNADNKPAPYSKNNQPFKTESYLKISLKGVKEGDFTLVFGYPGQTQQYIPSFAVDMLVSSENPAAIQLREARLEVINNFMKADDRIRLQLSAKAAGIANYWKKMQGENRGVMRTNIIEKKQNLEIAFQLWADAEENRKNTYGKLLPVYQNMYKEYTPVNLAQTYFYEGEYTLDIIKFAWSFMELVKASQPGADKIQIANLSQKLIESCEKFYKGYNQELEKQLFVKIISLCASSPESNYKSTVYSEISGKFHGDWNKYTEFAFSSSLLSSKEKIVSFLGKYTIKKKKELENDPLIYLANKLISNYLDNIKPKIEVIEPQLDSLQRIFMKGQREMLSDKRFYPDANSTLRVAYGKVQGYFPADGVYYNWFTTLNGIIEKRNPLVDDYQVDEKLVRLFKTKDYGKWKDIDGTMHVAFIANNHTTGGNSGSPVLNANGQLIGINFDRCWEGTMSDIVYDPLQCRNITLDIRYCLFIIDKFAGASHLIDEMTLIE